uniref:C2 domain-containing protein n=1 Tax=Schistosoma mansoni TaxID=6183 RepID=A0A5K4EUB1_SCHMA
MLAPNIRHPKEVTVRVYKAENLRVAPRSDHKQKKVSQKWKCVILGGRKKISTECVYAPDGNPVWNFETTFKIATRGDPVVLLVSDSEDNHVGQVVVPGVTIPPKPTDPSVSLTHNSRLCIMEMEQTKKTEIGFGRLYFWIWVEEYRSEESKSRSAKGSVLSLSSLHLHKDKGSTPNSLNYSGSVLSLSSNNDEYKKKKRWYTKVANHAMHVPTSIQQSRSPSNSVSNTKSMNNSYNPFDYYQQNFNEEDGVIEEKDGSVLGAYSELTANSLSSSSAFATNQLKRRNSMHPSKRSGLIASNIDSSIKDSDEHLKSKPELLRIAPKCGPSSGGTELTIYCRFLTTEIMKQSTVFVGDHPVSRDDWFLDESSQSDLSQLRVHMPSLQPGRYSIYIDSVEFGRILCNQEFTYLHSDVNLIQSPTRNLAVSSMNEPTNKIINITPKTNTSVEETDSSVVFNRMGSQRSNLVLVDRRSGRRERSRPEALGRSDSLSSSILGGSSKMGTINHDKVDTNKHDNRTFNTHINVPSKELSSQAPKQNFLPTGESELVSSLGTPPKIKQSYKRISQSNLPNKPINSAKFNQNVNLMPTRRVSLTNSQNPFNEDTDATDCVSTLSGETSQTMEYNEFNKIHHGSDRSAASGRSKSIMGAGEEEGLKLENEALRSLLNDANHLISTIKSHTLTLETELNAKVNDVDRLSEELCRLKNRLLLDGLTQYLEKV